MHISEIPPSRPSPLLRAGKIATHHEESFFPSFLKVSIDHLFDNLESGKRIIVLEKSREKFLNFGSKNLYEPCINPFRPKSHQHQFSVDNISRSSRVKVMRITKLITKGRTLWSHTKLSQLLLKEMYGDQSGEFVCGSWGLRGEVTSRLFLPQQNHWWLKPDHEWWTHVVDTIHWWTRPPFNGGPRTAHPPDWATSLEL